MQSQRALVLGIGNYLLGDEGVGVHVAQALERQPLPAGVDVLDGGTGGFHLLGCFQDYPLIIIVDATMDGRPPGTVTRLKPAFLSEYPRSLSSHDIGLRDLLETAAVLGHAPRVHLVTVSIAEISSASVALSAPVADAATVVIEAVREILRSEGFTPTKPPAAGA